MPASVTGGSVPVPGGTIHFERSGEGPALLLVHSAFLDRREWGPQFASYADRHTVIRVDLRGHGRSTGDWSPSSDPDDLRAVVDHLGLPRVTVLGNSVGASSASAFAALNPDRVRGLILVAGYPPDLEPTSEEMARFQESGAERETRLGELMKAGRKEEAVELTLDIWAPKVPPSERRQLRAIASDNFAVWSRFFTGQGPAGSPPSRPVADTLRRGGLPLLAITGAHDNPADNMILARFASEVPDGRHVSLADGDHTPNRSSPAGFDRAVLGFLDGVAAERENRREPGPNT